MVDNIDEYVAHVNQVREDLLPADAIAYMKDCEAKGNYDDAKYQATLMS